LVASTVLRSYITGGGPHQADATLFQRQALDITLLTALMGGKRTVVGLLVLPHDPTPGAVDAWREEWRTRLSAFASNLPEHVTTVGTKVLRSLSLSELLEARRSHVEGRATADWERTVSEVVLADIDPREAEYIRDALVYDRAIGRGESPAKAIARARHISTRTAEGRISKARMLGYLTPAVSTRGAGELTPKARQLLGLSAEEGTTVLGDPWTGLPIQREE
jgi:hypothetical protein